MTSHKKPGWTFWTTVALVVVLFGYPLSLGPVDYLNSRDLLNDRAQIVVTYFYRPLGLACDKLPAADRAGEWYVKFWTKPPRTRPAARR